MTSRLYTLAVVSIWLLSMAWLAGSKIVPALRQGTPPDYLQEFRAAADAPPLPAVWTMYWDERPIGRTVSQAILAGNEPSELRVLVEFKNLDIRGITRELLGGMSFIADSLLGHDELRVDLDIATRLRLDWEGELQGFETSVRSAGSTELLFVRGQRTDEDKLRIFAFTGGEDAAGTAIPLSRELPLPPKARYADSFSPRSRMAGLFVGQRWTTPVVSPIASSKSIRLVESTVEKRETIRWNEEEAETFVVVYRYDSGSVAGNDAVGIAWVRDDGLVLRQELPLGGAVVRFERVSDEQAWQWAEQLTGTAFDRRLQRQATH